MSNEFWQRIDMQLDALKTARSATDVIAILDEPSSGDAFFAGSGGDGDVASSLREAGWDMVMYDAHYYWVMRAPNGDLITYVEGDVFRGNQMLPRGEATA